MGSTSGFFDALELLDDFVQQVVIDRRDSGLHRWVTWLKEDASAKPYDWLRPDFVLCPSPLSSRIPSLRLLGSWLSLMLMMLSSARRGCLSFVGQVILSSR